MCVVIEGTFPCAFNKSAIMVERRAKMLILVYRRDFCRILDRILRREGLTDFQHGDLSLACGSELRAPVGSPKEVFVISASSDRVEKLTGLLQACPIRGANRDIFELYAVDDD